MTNPQWSFELRSYGNILSYTVTDYTTNKQWNWASDQEPPDDTDLNKILEGIWVPKNKPNGLEGRTRSLASIVEMVELSQSLDKEY